MFHSQFEIIEKKHRTDDNSLFSVSPLHAPAIFEPKIIAICYNSPGARGFFRMHRSFRAKLYIFIILTLLRFK